MQELIGLTAQDLIPVAQSLSLRPFASFDEMTDLLKVARERLKEEFSLGFGAPVMRLGYAAIKHKIRLVSKCFSTALKIFPYCAQKLR